MEYQRDIMLDADDDLKIIDGDFLVDESYLQEVGIIIRLNSGELKSDPVLGPNLVQLMRGKYDKAEFDGRVRLHLSRDKKRYEDVKSLVHLKVS